MILQGSECIPIINCIELILILGVTNYKLHTKCPFCIMLHTFGCLRYDFKGVWIYTNNEPHNNCIELMVILGVWLVTNCTQNVHSASCYNVTNCHTKCPFGIMLQCDTNCQLDNLIGSSWVILHRVTHTVVLGDIANMIMSILDVRNTTLRYCSSTFHLLQ